MFFYRFIAVLDALFVAAATFIVAFIVFNYFTPAPFSFIFSGCVALIVVVFSAKRIFTKKTKFYSDGKTRLKADDFFFNLYLSGKDYALDLLYKAYKNNGEKAEIFSGAVILIEKNIVVYPAFSPDKLKKSDAVAAFSAAKSAEKKYGAEFSFVLATETASAEISSYFKSIGGKEILSGERLFSFLNNNGCAKTEYSLKKAKGFSLNYLPLKKQSGKYFLFGLLFAFMSFFAPIKLYYVIVATVFLILAAITRLFGTADKTVE